MATRDQIMYTYNLTSISQEDWDAFLQETGIQSVWTAEFDRARGNMTGNDKHGDMDPLMQRLVFPFICLLAGLALDVLGSRIKFGHFNVPSTIFQFVVALFIAILASIVLDKEVMCHFQNTYIWSSGAVSPSTIINLLMPVLIFESAFKMSSHAFLSNMGTIVTIAFCCYILCFALHGTLLWAFMFQFGVTGPSAYLFASMVSATDPVAVVALLEELGAPFSVRCIIEGESLVNDGMAIVVFKLCTMLWAHDDVWILNDLTDIAQILGCVLASPIVGYVFGRLCLWALTHAFNTSERQQQAAIFFSVYSVWIVAEVEMKGSGVLALVCFGLTLSHSQSLLKKDTVHEAITIWEFFAYWANCIVFIMAGYTLGVEFASDSSYLLTVLQGMLLYPIGLCARMLFMCIFYFVPTPDQRPPISHFICYTWGGLRGALPILLSLELTHVTHQAEMYHTARLAVETERAVHVNLVLCCGTVLMSLLLQGLSFESLLQKMGLTRDSPYKVTMKHKVFKHLLKHTQHELEQMKSRRTHGGTKWEYVTDVVNYVFMPYKMGLIQPNNPQDMLNKDQAQALSAYASSAYYQPAALEHSVTASVHEEETWIQLDLAQGTSVKEVDSHEINRSYMLLLKAKVQSSWEEGLLSGATIEFLTNLIEHAIDRGSVTHVEVFRQLLSKEMTWSRLLHKMGDTLNSAVHYMRKIKLLPFTPREHPKGQDYWYIVSMLLSITHVALLLVALTNWLYDTDYPETFMFFDILFVSAFVVEQIIMWPLTKLTLKKKNNWRGRVIVAICLMETAAYSILGVMMLIMVFPYNHGNQYTDPRICLINKHWVWVVKHKDEKINHHISSFCNVSKVLLKVVPVINALTKIVLTIPRAIYLGSELMKETALRRFRVTLSALLALRFITDDLAVEEFEFPNPQCRTKCIEMNIEMRNLLDMLLRKEVMNNTEYAHQIRVIRTRQSARLLLADIREQILDRVKTGTLAKDDIGLTMHHIDQASEYVGAITRVYDHEDNEQLSIVNDAVQSSLLFCAHRVADLLLTFESFKVPHILEPNTRMESGLPGLIFLYDGVLITYNERYSEKNFQPVRPTSVNTGAIRSMQPQTTVKFAGEWLNDFILLDNSAPKSSWYCLSRVKVCVVDMKNVQLMIEADGDFAMRRSVADNIARYKLKAFLRQHGRTLTDKQQEKLEITHVSDRQTIIAEANHSVLIFAGNYKNCKYDSHSNMWNSINLWNRTSDCLEWTETPIDLEPLPPVQLASYAIVPMEDLAAPDSTETQQVVLPPPPMNVQKRQTPTPGLDTGTISMTDMMPPSKGSESVSMNVVVEPTAAAPLQTARPSPRTTKSSLTQDDTSAVKIRALNE